MTNPRGSEHDTHLPHVASTKESRRKSPDVISPNLALDKTTLTELIEPVVHIAPSKIRIIIVDLSPRALEQARNL